MSLYREAGAGRRRRRLGVAAAAAVLALTGVGISLLATGDPSTADRSRELQSSAEPALQALELIPIHYASADPVTHRAAADQLAVAREAVAGIEPELRSRDAASTRALLAELDRLRSLMGTTGRTGEVERAAAAAASRLRALVGLKATAARLA